MHSKTPIKQDIEYREIFENAPQGIVVTTFDGQFIRANQAFASILGFASFTELQSHITDIGHQIWVDPQARLDMINRLHSEKKVYLETQFWCKNGEPIWVSMAVWGTHNEAGEIVNIEAILEDITERKLTEQRLIESETQFKVMAETTHNMMVIVRLSDNVIIYCNSSIERILGFTPKDLIGSVAADFYANPADRVRMMEQFQEHGLIQNYETRFCRRDGSSIWISHNSHQAQLNGELHIFSEVLIFQIKNALSRDCMIVNR